MRTKTSKIKYHNENQNFQNHIQSMRTKNIHHSNPINEDQNIHQSNTNIEVQNIHQSNTINGNQNIHQSNTSSEVQNINQSNTINGNQNTHQSNGTRTSIIQIQSMRTKTSINQILSIRTETSINQMQFICLMAQKHRIRMEAEAKAKCCPMSMLIEVNNWIKSWEYSVLYFI